MKKLTTQEFIYRANKIHNFKYDYSKTIYKHGKIKVIIVCPEHGEFLQRASTHLEGHQCSKCTNNIKLTTKEFIEKANKIHKLRYDYSRSNYINAYSKIIIICKRHGKFLQKPNLHLSGRGCQKCNGNNKLSTKEFIKRAKKIHGNRYSYLKTRYINANTKVIIICEKHGEFSSLPGNHLGKHNCPICTDKKISQQEFIKRTKIIHDSKYNYSKTKYKNYHTKVIIICKKHNEFKQTPASHLRGANCPSCSHNKSKSEIKWLNEIEKEQNIKIERNKTIYINGKRFYPDGFYKPTNTWYEYNGCFIHGHPDYYNPNDINKMIKKTFGELYQHTLNKERAIKSAGYKLITKWGD